MGLRPSILYLVECGSRRRLARQSRCNLAIPANHARGLRTRVQAGRKLTQVILARPGSRSSIAAGLVHRREDKGMVVTVSAAVAGDLADVVDRVRVDQRPSRVLRDQGVQV